jgi:hypothetical protein
MPNHFHLLLQERESGGISQLMLKMTTAYVMYFNKKYERSGSLLSRPFRAKHINTDDYFRWVISYMHINPVADTEKSGRQNRLDTYRYSSYPDYYMDARPEGKIISKDSLPIDISDLEKVEEMLETQRKYQGEPLIFGGDNS